LSKCWHKLKKPENSVKAFYKLVNRERGIFIEDIFGEKIREL
jgi:hypothetical protein